MIGMCEKKKSIFAGLGHWDFEVVTTASPDLSRLAQLLNFYFVGMSVGQIGGRGRASGVGLGWNRTTVYFQQRTHVGLPTPPLA